MSSRTKATRLPEALIEAAELRARALGYPTFTDYLKGLMRYDLMVQGGHDITQPLSKLSGLQQDRVDDRMLELTRRGKGERGQLLTHLLERMKKGEPLGDALNAA